MSEAYSYLCFGIPVMYIGQLLIEWVMLESKFIKEYHKTNFKIHLVILPIIAALTLLMCVMTRQILLFIIMSCAIGHSNYLTREMLYGKIKDNINDRKE